MKNSSTFENAKLFNLKSFEKMCRFGISISSKKKDGGYTKGAFINCICFEQLDANKQYTLNGYFGANEYQDKASLEFIVQTAVAQGQPNAQNAHNKAESNG